MHIMYPRSLFMHHMAFLSYRQSLFRCRLSHCLHITCWFHWNCSSMLHACNMSVCLLLLLILGINIVPFVEYQDIFCLISTLRKCTVRTCHWPSVASWVWPRWLEPSATRSVCSQALKKEQSTYSLWSSNQMINQVLLHTPPECVGHILLNTV